MAVVLPVGRYDAGPAVAAPATLGVTLACCAATAFAAARPGALAAGGLVPAALWGDAPSALPPGLTTVTALALHSGALHLLYNLAVLWVFGPPVERRLGAGRFATFVLGTGAASLVAQSLWAPGALVPIVGLSGATAALVGAFVVLHPRAHVAMVLLFLTVPMPVRVLAGLWMGGELAVLLAMAAGWEPMVPLAHVAHLAGCVLGAAILSVLPLEADLGT